ncbi:hypothetical protein BR93DRAFT_606989 [Coniochaeta sp. PMI_546]|nr:hypothetical protein BR93DRAFT_606989 [Coniochaeta sp. PMI_546]
MSGRGGPQRQPFFPACQRAAWLMTAKVVGLTGRTGLTGCCGCCGMGWQCNAMSGMPPQRPSPIVRRTIRSIASRCETRRISRSRAICPSLLFFYFCGFLLLLLLRCLFVPIRKQHSQLILVCRDITHFPPLPATYIHRTFDLCLDSPAARTDFHL